MAAQQVNPVPTLDPLGDLREAHARLARDIAEEQARLTAERDALEAALKAAAAAADEAA